MYVYNENGNMITGPVTESENNLNGIWGSWVYKGDLLTIEIKVPIKTKEKLLLHLKNIAYGYKEIYSTQVGGFGQSAPAPCNTNVLCPLGNTWEPERNSVALGISGDGSGVFSGSLIMNTCYASTPYFLTANHVFEQATPVRVVSGWRFTFQAWSPTCTPSQNADGVTYNGSTLRANWAGSDFCLVELNNNPPANSGINYAGWSRETGGIAQTTIIHHPKGDVMKISRDFNSPTSANFLGAACWHLTTDDGTTEYGSSGGPYFDQNHRIIGQHYGVNDATLPICEQRSKFGGRFDASWAGGGTNTTRLNNWLDPGNTGAFSTNTTNVNSLIAFNSGSASIINGDNQVLCVQKTYFVGNLPAGTPVSWSATPQIGYVSLTPSGNNLVVKKLGNNGTVTLSASFTHPCTNQPVTITKQIQVGFYTPSFTVFAPTGYCPGNGYEAIATAVGNTSNTGTITYNWYINGTLDSYHGYKIVKQFGGSSGTNIGVTVQSSNCAKPSDEYYQFFACNGFYRIHPNPTSSTITIETQFGNGFIKVRITDKMGVVRKVFNYAKDTKVATLNITEFIPDVYNIQVYDGKTWFNKQVIKN